MDPIQEQSHTYPSSPGHQQEGLQVTWRQACPPGKYKYAPTKRNFDRHCFFLEFGCPSSSYFCSAANKPKLSSTESKAPSLLPVQGHSTALPRSKCLLHSVGTEFAEPLQFHPRNYPSPPPPPKTSLTFYVCPFISHHRVCRLVTSA